MLHAVIIIDYLMHISLPIMNGFECGPSPSLLAAEIVIFKVVD